VTFTKDWQRVGDMAARTIVIRKDSIAEQRLMAPSAISTSWNVPLMRSRSHPASDSAFRWRFTITAAIAGDRGRLLRAANRLLGRKVDWGRI